MKPLIVIISLIVVNVSFSQNEEKITIYLKYTPYDSCTRTQKFYYKREQGTVFNLGCESGGSVLYTKNADTLPITGLRKFKFSIYEEVEQMEKQWRASKKGIKKNGVPFSLYDKNGIFNTYMVEVLNDKVIVVYPVLWRSTQTVH